MVLQAAGYSGDTVGLEDRHIYDSRNFFTDNSADASFERSSL